MPSNQPVIALTPGEPAGIGPDLCVQLARQEQDCRLLAIADPELLASRARLLGLPLEISCLRHSEQVPPHRAGRLSVLPVALAAEPVCGQLNPANSAYVLQTIRLAVQGCLRRDFAAMVTGPVHKAVINQAGVDFTGHTEFIAAITGGEPVMMLATPGLRVALATTHLPLAQVSAAINTPGLIRLLQTLHADLRRRFDLPDPKILVCGLNPHAGEGGYLGREEIDVIQPALDFLRSQGMRLIGPLPADTLFNEKNLSQADAVLAMYHDQGLPVLKYKGFGNAVNITLGLPIIRASVDHGAALDLAGSGRADAGSLRLALQTAIDMARAA